MKTWKRLLVLLLAATAILAAGTVSAHDHHRGRAHFGVFIGAPVWPSWYYYPPAYYYPPQVVTVPVPTTPPVYIEQTPAPAAPAENYWYYCTSPSGYYPYIKQCPGGWLKVAPQP